MFKKTIFSVLLSGVAMAFASGDTGLSNSLLKERYEGVGGIDYAFGGLSVVVAPEFNIWSNTYQNFRKFCRECVYRDLQLGLYTQEELQTAPNTLNFLKERTSKIRTCLYRSPNEIEAERKLLSCNQVVEQISQEAEEFWFDPQLILRVSKGIEYGKELVRSLAFKPLQTDGEGSISDYICERLGCKKEGGEG